MKIIKNTNKGNLNNSIMKKTGNFALKDINVKMGGFEDGMNQNPYDIFLPNKEYFL